MSRRPRQRYTIGSLCSGVGGLDLGLEWAGLGPVKWQVENDPFCTSILERHWPHVTRHGDIKEVHPRDLSYVDVVCAGFPCQPHSHAGSRKGRQDERWLWPDIFRIVHAIHPRVVIIENVPGLRTVDCGHAFRDILYELSSCGYDAVWFPVRADECGAPHERERLFIVGYLAYSDGERRHVGAGDVGSTRGWRESSDGHATRSAVADTHDQGQLQPSRSVGEVRRWAGYSRSVVADSDIVRSVHEEAVRTGRITVVGGRTTVLGHTDLPRLEGRPLPRRQRPDEQASGSRGRSRAQGVRGIVEPGLGHGADGLPEWLARWPAERGAEQHAWEPPRTASGVANRAKQLKALGNAVVPQVAYEVGLMVRWLLDQR